jgi:hypothetical protein
LVTDVRDGLRDLDVWLSPFLEVMGRKTRRNWAPLYLQGLLGPDERKSLQPMAARLGLPGRDQLQHFITTLIRLTWDDGPLWTVGGADAYLVIDDTAPPKKGTLPPHEAGFVGTPAVGRHGANIVGNAASGRYPSDVSDEERVLVAPYLTLPPDAGQREQSLREAFKRPRYIIKSDAPWRWMPMICRLGQRCISRRSAGWRRVALQLWRTTCARVAQKCQASGTLSAYIDRNRSKRR